MVVKFKVRPLLAAVCAMAGLAGAHAALAQPADPYVYMEEAEGAKALDFARSENARTLPRLESDPRYAGLYADALAVATAKDRIAALTFAGDGSLRNFWQDAEHVRGVWRSVDLASYRTGTPAWKTILDLDALARAEKANLVWKGAICRPPEGRYCLVSLSNGGKDAVEIREFDTVSGAFVSGGFHLPEGKHRFDWVDADTLIVATEWTKGEVTASGYPYVVKLVKRGQTLAAAKEVFRGKAADGGYGVSPLVLRDPDGKAQAIVVDRPLDTFSREYYLISAQGPVNLPLPKRATIHDYVAGQMVVTLEEDWQARNLKEGDLISFNLAALKAKPATAPATLVLRPKASQAIETVRAGRTRLVVAMLDNVKGQLVSLRHAKAGWIATTLDLPKDATLALGSVSDRDDRLFVSATGFLTPTSQILADAGTGRHETLRTLPAKFDGSKDVVEQFWATSKDGTKVPYFVVRPKDLKFDGTAPTLMTAYGGFQVSQTPSYSPAIGKLWLERGGVFVLANIRGGGEFGPAWHNAGLKLNRMRVYDDFFAVSQDLIARKITSPRRLGIRGGSNGGLLMGVALTQHPELYRAIDIQVPLFDMLAYTHIGAGDSWVGEYGDPAVPAERAVIETYSPYQRLAPNQPYPLVYIETSTKDDRVHPAHARKAAARLKEMGYDYLYYEDIDGGHSAGANLNDAARRQALEYVYMSQRLMD